MAIKSFHLGDILSITTGRLLSPRLIEGVYDILDFMTGDSLWTHQLPRASDECKPYLLDAMPWLKEIDFSGVNEHNYKEWIAQHVKKYGEYHNVSTIPQDDHDVIDPREELKEMLDGDDSKIIDVIISNEESPSPYGDIDWTN